MVDIFATLCSITMTVARRYCFLDLQILFVYVCIVLF